MNPHQVTKDFERALCEYTGAPYAVAVTSCTMALLLAVAWHLRYPAYIVRGANAGDLPFYQNGRPVAPSGITWISDSEVALIGQRPAIEIPKRTYVSVPQSIIHAGGRPTFRDEDWHGLYRLDPLPVWDSARWFSGGMYMKDALSGKGAMMCVSFHAAKPLGDTQGGAILHDSPEADVWLRRARFDGRTEGVAPKDDRFDIIGWHCYMSPDVAARLLWALSVLPKHNEPLPNDDYPDLSEMNVFR